MENTLPREQILQNIRKGLQKAEFKKIEDTVNNNLEIFVTPDKSMVELFEEEITKINGEFHYCQDTTELIDKLVTIHNERNLSLCYSPDSKLLEIIKLTGIPYTNEFKNEKEIKSGISRCEFLIARFGSVMVSSALPGARRIFSFPEIHIVIAYENQLVMELEDALDGIKEVYGEELPTQITNITGPSRTADIEKTLILGAHGPKQLIVFLLRKT